LVLALLPMLVSVGNITRSAEIPPDRAVS
jgi:hypothetical protein